MSRSNSRPATRLAEMPPKIDVTEKRKATYTFADQAGEEEWRRSLQSTAKAAFVGTAGGNASRDNAEDYAARKADAGRTHFCLGNEEGPVRTQTMSAFGRPERAERDPNIKFADSRKSQLWASEADVQSWKSTLQTNTQASYAQESGLPMDRAPAEMKKMLLAENRRSNVMMASSPTPDAFQSTTRSAYAAPVVTDKYEKVHKVHTASTAFAANESSQGGDASVWQSTQQRSYVNAGPQKVERVHKVHTASSVQFGDPKKAEYKSTLRSDYSPVKYAV